MFEQETYVVERAVACNQCDFDGEQDIAVIVDGGIEFGEWECPGCQYTNDYENNTVWDRVDEYIDRMKEERAWSEG